MFPLVSTYIGSQLKGLHRLYLTESSQLPQSVEKTLSPFSNQEDLRHREITYTAQIPPLLRQRQKSGPRYLVVELKA